MLKWSIHWRSVRLFLLAIKLRLMCFLYCSHILCILLLFMLANAFRCDANACCGDFDEETKSSEANLRDVESLVWGNYVAPLCRKPCSRCFEQYCWNGMIEGRTLSSVYAPTEILPLPLTTATSASADISGPRGLDSSLVLSRWSSGVMVGIHHHIPRPRLRTIYLLPAYNIPIFSYIKFQYTLSVRKNSIPAQITFLSKNHALPDR